MANLLSCALPWLIIIPFQTGYWLNTFTNWTTLIVSGPVNFVLPFYLYYKSTKRHHLKDEIIRMEIEDKKSAVEMEKEESSPQLLENNPRKTSHESIQSTKSLSIQTYRSISPNVSPEVSPKVSPIIMSENQSEGNYFDSAVINTSTITTDEIELEKTHNQIPSANCLDVPQLILHGDQGLPCSTPRSTPRARSTMTVDYEMHHQPFEKYLSAPASVVSCNSLKRRKSSSTTPVITNNGQLDRLDQLDLNVDPLDMQRFNSSHPSLISSDNTNRGDDNTQKSDLNNNDNGMFKAFPWISEINGTKIAIGCGAFSIMLLCGIIIYDIVLLAMGTNVFSS